MSYDPFRGNGEGTSLDHEDPISGATKQAAKAVNQQTAQQVKAANRSFVDQLYGNVPAADETDPTANPGQAAAQVQKAATPSPSGLTPAANPQEQAQLDETRKKLLEMQHKKSYFNETFGEAAQQKRRQREEEEAQLKAREEEEQKEKEEAEKARMEESLQSFQSHGKGPAQLGDQVALTQAKTRTEINRGTSG